MAGNSQRRGAKRNPGSKKGQTVGSGGQRRRALQGRGPTPKASERAGHPAARRRGTGAGSGGGASAGSAGAGGTARTGRGDRAARTDRAGRPGRGAGSRPGPASAELVLGRNAVVEALRGRVPATALYLAANLDSDDRVKESIRLASDAGIALLEGSRADLDRLTAGAAHQGVALQVPAYDYATPEQLLTRAIGPPLVVALDGVTDPRNLGAVVRSAAAFGGHGVLVPERRAAGMTAAAWKTSAGAAARLPVARATNLTRALEAYQAAGLFVVGLDVDGTVGVDELEVATEPLVLVVGAEGAGLSRLVKERCDLLARIPMAGGTESLNASVAAGVALYEIARRRAGRSSV
jgi:23S rRNA (guanosine2251-2'-O)-methyltransferase